MLVELHNSIVRWGEKIKRSGNTFCVMGLKNLTPSNAGTDRRLLDAPDKNRLNHRSRPDGHIMLPVFEVKKEIPGEL